MSGEPIVSAVGNVVPYNRKVANYIMTAECPDCYAIFTIKFKNVNTYIKRKEYNSLRFPCPKCGSTYNWFDFKIFKFTYKWKRFWRGLKKGENDA